MTTHTADKGVELKACPFCGKPPEIVCRDVEPQGDPWYGGKYETFAICECGVALFDGYFHEGFGPEKDPATRQRIAAAWNTRPSGGEAVACVAEYLKNRDEALFAVPDDVDDAERKASAEDIVRSIYTSIPSPGAVEALRTIPTGALDALEHGQRQIDMDGVEVAVSRQAVDEVVAAVRAAILAYESSRSQSSDARDAVIEECREALFVQIVLAQRAASYDDISEILDALKRPADRKGTTGITPDRGFAGMTNSPERGRDDADQR